MTKAQGHIQFKKTLFKRCQNGWSLTFGILKQSTIGKSMADYLIWLVVSHIFIFIPTWGN